MSYLIDAFRDKEVILEFARRISRLANGLPNIKIMEVCGGHTHTIMKYGLPQLMPNNIEFIHGPGCPVCIMPKGRIDQAYELAQHKDVILITLGDMIKVPGSHGSLQRARAQGCDVRFVYSPLDALKIAQENPGKKVVYFAIGFETTTPMTAALIERAIASNTKNLLFHINHVTVPEPVCAILDSPECALDALLAPSHVSVIAGAKIYKPIVNKYQIPTVVAGFEPVDVMESVEKIIKQLLNRESRLEVQYARSVTTDGNLKAQAMIERYFVKRDGFVWRGIGRIPHSALRLRDEFCEFDAEVVFKLKEESPPDHKACRCGDILRGIAKPNNCKVFAKACTPDSPLGSCMVSSEGACAAYYKYGQVRFA
ncbi:MAG: hydrogenase formation protein HypD [Wolinella sp.]